MDEIFFIFEPNYVKGMLDDMFTGYINSELCAVESLGQMYEFKRMLTAEADKRLKSQCHD